MWKEKPTTAAVWKEVMAAHMDEMTVFSLYSAPGGDFFHGNHDTGVITTEWGFRNSPYPLIGARTEWDIIPGEPSHIRRNERTTHWFCIPISDD